MDRHGRDKSSYLVQTSGQHIDDPELLLGPTNDRKVYVQTSSTKRLKVDDDEVEVMTGDFKVTSGDMTLDTGDLTLTTGNLILTAGSVVSTADKSSIQIYKDPTQGVVATQSGLSQYTSYEWPLTHMLKHSSTIVNFDVGLDNWVKLTPADETQKILFVWNATVSLTGTSGTYKELKFCFRNGNTCPQTTKILCEVNSSRWTQIGGNFIIDVDSTQHWKPVFSVQDSVGSSVTLEFKSYQISVTQL